MGPLGLDIPMTPHEATEVFEELRKAFEIERKEQERAEKEKQNKQK
ncbi:TPA: hypothetical protein K8Z91_000221 [Staphylococcus pseudintermedius]|nr:hypothetical protein [Staphylococcus pseudintermedius]